MRDMKNSLMKIVGGTKIITVGNEKGGSGKSTCAFHIAVALLRMGYKVGTIDLDARQGTMTRYIQNRWDRVAKLGEDLPCPTHIDLRKSTAGITIHADEEEEFLFYEALRELSKENDYIVIDSPGHNTNLNRLGHVYADILITPINDSLIDLDVLARIDNQTGEIKRPSFYSEMVWEQKKRRAALFGKSMDWYVIRNRMGHVNSNNKKALNDLLDKISRRFGFRIAPGMGERVIYKELFLEGLTMMDIGRGNSFRMSVSHLAAKNEIRHLIRTIGIAPKTKSTPNTKFIPKEFPTAKILHQHPLSRISDDTEKEKNKVVERV